MKRSICGLAGLGVFIVIGLLGCSQTSESALKEFEAIARHINAELPSKFDDKEETICEPVSFDVEKTDSLVSPYTATLLFSFSAVADSLGYVIVTQVEVNYVYQEGVWISKRLRTRIQDLKYVSGDKGIFRKVRNSAIGRSLSDDDADDVRKLNTPHEANSDNWLTLILLFDE